MAESPAQYYDYAISYILLHQLHALTDYLKQQNEGRQHALPETPAI